MNEKITTLGRVAEAVEAQARNHHDRLVPVKEIAFHGVDEVRIGSVVHSLRPTAARAIATRLGVPYPYLERSPQHIQAVNLNHWLRHERNDELFLRFEGVEVRAIFTPRYKPVDHVDVLRELDRLGYGPATPVQVRFDERFLLLNISDPTEAFEVRANDRCMPGISIGNSEVGLAALSVSAFVLRLVCTNGMVAREKTAETTYRHISERVLQELPAILQGARGDVAEHRHRFTLSLQSPVRDPMATLQSFNKQFQLSEAETTAVEWAWPFEQGSTMFQMVNTYTRASQHPELAADSAYRLQRVGGRILSMVRDDGRVVGHG